MFPLSIISLLMTEAVDTVGGMIVEPVLPIYMRNSVGISPFHVTCMSAVYSLVQVFMNVRLGALSDRVGRKPVLVCGILGEARALPFLSVSPRSPLSLSASLPRLALPSPDSGLREPRGA